MPWRSAWAAAPPSASLSMSSPVAALTSAGPAMPIVAPRTITTKSASADMFDGPAKPDPIIAAQIGAQPDRSTSCWKLVETAAKWRLSSPSWIRWPPPSSIET